MFVATVINFLLSSLNTGVEVVIFILFIRTTLILDIEHPLSASNALTIIGFWSQNLPVSSNVSLLNSVFIYARRRYYSAISLSFGELGFSSRIDSG